MGRSSGDLWSQSLSRLPLFPWDGCSSKKILLISFHTDLGRTRRPLARSPHALVQSASDAGSAASRQARRPARRVGKRVGLRGRERSKHLANLRENQPFQSSARRTHHISFELLPCWQRNTRIPRIADGEARRKGLVRRQCAPPRIHGFSECACGRHRRRREVHATTLLCPSPTDGSRERLGVSRAV